MQAILSRMKYMRLVEGVSAFLLPWLFWRFWYPYGGQFSWQLQLGGMAMVSYILLQGAYYWHLKQAAQVNRTPLPAYFHALFKGFQWSNVAGLCAMALALVYGATGSTSPASMLWACGLTFFALLEHINYYHHQLMYDTRGAFAGLFRHRRLRKAALAVDLMRAGRAAR